MFNEGVADRLRSNEFTPGTIRPDYQDYNFANVTPTVASVLGVDCGRQLPADALGSYRDVSNVLVVIIDGVRYDRWLETEAPLFQRARSRGLVTPLTSVYPSETAAAMTTYHTGRQPVQHGLLGWEQYFEAVGEQVEPLKSRTVDRRSLEAEIEAGTLDSFAGGTIHSELKAADVGSAVVQPEGTLTHAFAAERHQNATSVPFGNPGEGAVEATNALESPDHSFVSLYYTEVDSVSHVRGTQTTHYEATMYMLSAGLERALGGVDADVAADTLVLFTADHGHVETGPDTTGTVLTEIAAVTENLARGADGEPIMPTGGARNVHLHLQNGSVEEVRTALSDLNASIWTQSEALDADLFGDREPSDRFRQRCGDLILVPNDSSIWYDSVKFEHLGQHGGLHPDEMLIPFTAVRLSELVE